MEATVQTFKFFSEPPNGHIPLNYTNLYSYKFLGPKLDPLLAAMMTQFTKIIIFWTKNLTADHIVSVCRWMFVLYTE